MRAVVAMAAAAARAAVAVPRIAVSSWRLFTVSGAVSSAHAAAAAAAAAASTATPNAAAAAAAVSRRREGLPRDDAVEGGAAPAAAPRIRVLASYATTRVDVAKLAKRAALEWKLADAACKVEKDWVIFRLPAAEYGGSDAAAGAAGAAAAAAAGALPSVTHVSVSRRGAVVVVNAPPTRGGRSRFDLDALLADKAITSGSLPGELSEDLTVVLAARSDSSSSSNGGSGSGGGGGNGGGGGGDGGRSDGDNSGGGGGGASSDAWVTVNRRGELVLAAHDLELDAIRILNSCMAQTVNLQYFEGKVDRMYETVQDIFRSLEEGSGTRFNTNQLYKHLGDTSSIANAVVLSGLRNTVRPGSTAWNEERYAQMQGVLWTEFDLEDRYEELERRLTWISDTVKYALEVAKDNKSITLERLIVALIAMELAISVVSAGILQPVLDLFK